MSATAKRLIRQAVKTIEKEDGTSECGCYRDVVTELLHLANKRFKTGPYSGPEMLYHWICSMGYDAFVEELEIAESGKLESIPDSDLPLHSIDEFQYDSNKKRFEERLKTGGHNGKSLHNMRKKNRKGDQTP